MSPSFWLDVSYFSFLNCLCCHLSFILRAGANKIYDLVVQLFSTFVLTSVINKKVNEIIFVVVIFREIFKLLYLLASC